MAPYVVATLECGYAFRLKFYHSADKNRYAQKIPGYVPEQYEQTLVVLGFLIVIHSLHYELFPVNVATVSVYSLFSKSKTGCSFFW